MSFDWVPLSAPEEAPSLKRILPKEILYELDEPLLFSAETSKYTLLCYKTDADPPYSQYIVTPSNTRVINNLRLGVTTLRSALSQAWSWLVEADDASYTVNKSWVLYTDEIPEGVLPKDGLGLYLSHGIVGSSRSTSPYLSIKYRGGAIKNKTIPFGILKTSVDETYKSLWRIFSPGIQSAAKNVKEQTLRRVVNIPTYELLHSSLLIEIEKPEIDLSRMRSRPEIDIELADKNIDDAHDSFLESTQSIAAAVVNKSLLTADLASSNFDAIEAVNQLIPSYNSFFEAIEINGKRPDKIIKPLIIDAHDGQIIREIYEAARGSVQNLRGEVFLVNGDSDQFTMRVGYRKVTCVATTDGQRLAVRGLRNGDLVEVRGIVTQRTHRDLLRMHLLRVNDLTIT